MKKLFLTLAVSGMALSASATAQTANTPSPLTTPGSMNNTQTINPATNRPYQPQVDMTAPPQTPQSTAINPATGTPYTPQVNINPQTNPATVGSGTSAQPPTTTTTAPQQPNTAPTSSLPTPPASSQLPPDTTPNG